MLVLENKDRVRVLTANSDLDRLDMDNYIPTYSQLADSLSILTEFDLIVLEPKKTNFRYFSLIRSFLNDVPCRLIYSYTY